MTTTDTVTTLQQCVPTDASAGTLPGHRVTSSGTETTFFVNGTNSGELEAYHDCHDAVVGGASQNDTKTW